MHLHSESDIPAKLSEASRKRRAQKVRRHNERFLRGPIALRWVCAAARLPGKPLAVAMAVMFKVGVERCDTVAVSSKLLERFGVVDERREVGAEHLAKRLARVDAEALALVRPESVFVYL